MVGSDRARRARDEEPMAKAQTPPDKSSRAGAASAGGGAQSVSPAASITSFSSAVRYLLDRADIERMRADRVSQDMFKLDRMRELLKVLGDPHLAFRSVHVAGTKGKGSTCEMIATCLEACGYTVGLYTSPHLSDVRERIRISRRPIGPSDFARLAARAAEAAAALPADAGEPTFFELVTAMAFLHFADEAVDIAVIECGLGGRLDSTNVITPLVSVVTSISLDHMQILGDTVEKIAAEKAGIFKAGVPAITCVQKPGVLEAMRAVAASVSAPLHVVGEDIDFSYRFEQPSPGSGSGGGGGPIVRATLTSPRHTFEHIAVPLKGEHQAANCGLALAAIDRLAERGFKTPASLVTQGMAQVTCPGRLEQVWDAPKVVLDAAHNADSMKCLMKALGAHFTYDSLVVIFGCAADKDIAGMLAQLDLGADKVIFTRARDNKRAADPRELYKRFSELTGKMSQVADDFDGALNIARRAVTREDLVCVTGSFYLVGEAWKYLKELAAKRATGG
jgi:dihydrofolate synthase/folylpolyglutamate synthase